MEECDSTWGSDSESDEPPAEEDSGISDSERAAGDTSPQVRRQRVRDGGLVSQRYTVSEATQLHLQPFTCTGVYGAS